MHRPRKVPRARVARVLMALGGVALLLTGCGSTAVRRASTHAMPTVHATPTGTAMTFPTAASLPTAMATAASTLGAPDPSLCIPGSNLAPLPTTWNTLYLTTKYGHAVSAFSASDGSLRWTYDIVGANASVTDVIHDGGSIYVDVREDVYANGGTSLREYLVALGAADGAIHWQEGTFSPLIVTAGEVLYVASGHGMLAVDAATGTTLWTTQFDVDVSIASATLINGTLFVGGSGTSPMVEALHASDGTVLWRAKVSSGSSLPLVVANGLVYVAASQTSLEALDATSGAVRWRVDLGDFTPRGAVASGTGLYMNGVQGSGPATYALNALTGALCWVAASMFRSYVNDANGGGAASTPVLDGTLLYQTMFLYNPGPPDPGHDELFALDARTGEQRWSVPVTGQTAIVTPASLVNNALYLNGNPALAVRTAEGAAAWTDTEPSAYPNYSTIQVIGSTVYAAYANGHVRALNAADGTVRWNIALPALSPPAKYSLLAGV